VAVAELRRMQQPVLDALGPLPPVFLQALASTRWPGRCQVTSVSVLSVGFCSYMRGLPC
jgi:hypothetical protein